MAEGLRRLLGPNEILDLADRQSVTLRIINWEHGMETIHPRYPGAPAEKDIEVLRLHLAPGVKATPPMYYDLTAKTLIAQMLPLLERRGFENYLYVITKYGVPPKARFTVEQRPL